MKRTLALSLLALSGCSEPKEVAAPVVAALPEQELPQIPFKEVSAELGVDFVFTSGAMGEKLLPEVMVAGIALSDLDNDGDLDLLAVKGHEPGQLTQNLAVYINTGAQFEEQSKSMNLHFTGYGLGINVADYDGDGWRDIFVASLGKNQLFRNLEGRSFVDVTEAMGVAGEADDFTIAGVFFDADNDRKLELFVLNYLHWDKEVDLSTTESLVGVARTYNGPGVFKGSSSRLYRRSDSGFEEISAQSGIEIVDPYTGEHIGKGLGVLPIDLNRDGYLDLVVANDRIRNFAFINDGTGQFVEQGEDLGLAYDNGGRATAAMGIDVGVLDGGDTMHIGMGNFSGEMTSLYRQRIRGQGFIDDAAITGVGLHTRMAVTFGLTFDDLDLDGHQEIIQANGHTEPEINKSQQSQFFRQSPQILYNCPDACDRQFELLPADHVGDLHQPLAGRSLASGDIDQDGDIDLVFSDIDGRLRIYRNEQASQYDWLQIDLIGPCGDTDAIGSKVVVTSRGQNQTRFVTPARSYASQNAATLTYGLGEAAGSVDIQVTWLGGTVTRKTGVPTKQRISISHPDSCVKGDQNAH